MFEETEIPFNAADFIKGLEAIYKYTHPPEGLQEEVVEV